MILSLNALNALVPRISAGSVLGPEHLKALASPDFRDRISQVARFRIKLHGPARSEGEVHVYPEMKLQTVVLQRAAAVNANGHVTALEEETVQFPMPGTVHVRAVVRGSEAKDTKVLTEKHVGLYVYRREFLPTFVALPPTPLERSERLEQLRILEHGYRMAVAVAEARYHGIDTPEQYEAFVRREGLRD